MSTIINLRGTSGAGKSTVVHTLLRMYNYEVVEYFGARGTRPLVYKLLPDTAAPGALTNPLYVFGSYKTQCGGCDGITDYKTIVPELLRQYAPQGDILFEGLLISGGLGSVGNTLIELEEAGHKVFFALLDTPLEVCLERVNQRRQARGVAEPVNPKNTEQKHKAALQSQHNIMARGLTAVGIRHKTPVKDVLALLNVTLTREPKHARANG